jgi:hypothetical protein
VPEGVRRDLARFDRQPGDSQGAPELRPDGSYGRAVERRSDPATQWRRHTRWYRARSK